MRLLLGHRGLWHIELNGREQGEAQQICRHQATSISSAIKSDKQKEDWEIPILFLATRTVMMTFGEPLMPFFLALNELEASASFLAAVLLAFLDARIAGHETASSELFAESLVIFDECA